MALSLSGLLVLSAGACRGKEKESDDIEVAPGDKQEETEVPEEVSEVVSDLEATISWWTYPVFVQDADQEDGTYEQTLIQEFNKKYPNIHVNLNVLNYGEFLCQSRRPGGFGGHVYGGSDIGYGQSGDLKCL